MIQSSILRLRYISFNSLSVLRNLYRNQLHIGLEKWKKSTSFWPKATDERLAWNDVTNGSNRTPKEYPKPSENSIWKNNDFPYSYNTSNKQACLLIVFKKKALNVPKSQYYFPIWILIVSNSYDMRNLQEQVKKTILLPKIVPTFHCLNNLF